MLLLFIYVLALTYLLCLSFVLEMDDDDDDDILDDRTDDDDDDRLSLVGDAVPAPSVATKRRNVDSGAVSCSVTTIPENQVEFDKIIRVDDPPFIKQFMDIDMTWHTVIRFVPPQGLVITDDDLDLLFIKQSGAQDGRSWEIRYPTPSILYDITEEMTDEDWDEVWGSSSFQGKAAMMNKSLEIRNVYEQQNIIWRTLHIDLDEPMEVIEGLKLRAKGNFRVISLCLRGPTSELKKRKDSENALKKKRKIGW
jgi:hypothetical protein